MRVACGEPHLLHQDIGGGREQDAGYLGRWTNQTFRVLRDQAHGRSGCCPHPLTGRLDGTSKDRQSNADIDVT